MKSIAIINKVFKDNKFIENDSYNSSYEGFSFKHESKIYHSRLAKKTPNKDGYFVTFWKKINNINNPYELSDYFDYLIINIIDGVTLGYFILSKEDLIKHGIVSSNKSKGKMGFRVYPSWIKDLNSLASKTQKWQIKYFKEL